MVFEVLGASEIPNVANQLFGGEMAERVLDTAYKRR